MDKLRQFSCKKSFKSWMGEYNLELFYCAICKTFDDIFKCVLCENKIMQCK